MIKYIKKAFLYHWNLLGVATGAAIAFLSGRPDILMPVVAALEVIYLAALSSHSRFQNAVDAVDYKKDKDETESGRKLERMIKGLIKEDRTRYEQLRNLCIELRQIADRVKGNVETELKVISDGQVNSINRLLWMYLKLLYSKNALESFFKAIKEEDIQDRIKHTKKLLEDMGSGSKDNETESMRRKTLLDTLKTSRKRLENYRISKDKYDFIGLELERLNSKIASLAEMGINRQDPNLITSEINVVSSSIEKTERAMDELDFINGFFLQDEEPPDLLSEEKNKEYICKQEKRFNDGS